MTSLHVSALISAEGVRDDPMAWIGDAFDAEAVTASLAALERYDAFLMGRGAYEYFQPAWSGGGDPYADRIAAMPKYVFSATLERADWANTTIVRTDAVEAVRALPGTSILYGFTRLARSLLAAGLVDVLEFTANPVLAANHRPLRLLGAEPRANGAVALRWTP